MDAEILQRFQEIEDDLIVIQAKLVTIEKDMKHVARILPPLESGFDKGPESLLNTTGDQDGDTKVLDSSVEKYLNRKSSTFKESQEEKAEKEA